MRLLVTRPEPDATALAASLKALGHEVLREPLMAITACPGVRVELEDVHALLFTSANGLRIFASLCEERQLPVFTVGDATAKAARDAGFKKVHSAAGQVEDLAALVESALDPSAGKLFHAAGHHLAGDLKALLQASGFRVIRQVLYNTNTINALSTTACEAFRNRRLDGAFFFSPRTAQTFVRLAKEADIVSYVDTCDALCLSQAVAQKVRGLSWCHVYVASSPNQKALLELLSKRDNGELEVTGR